MTLVLITVSRMLYISYPNGTLHTLVITASQTQQPSAAVNSYSTLISSVWLWLWHRFHTGFIAPPSSVVDFVSTGSIVSEQSSDDSQTAASPGSDSNRINQEVVASILEQLFEQHQTKYKNWEPSGRFRTISTRRSLVQVCSNKREGEREREGGSGREWERGWGVGEREREREREQEKVDVWRSVCASSINCYILSAIQQCDVDTFQKLLCLKQVNTLILSAILECDSLFRYQTRQTCVTNSLICDCVCCDKVTWQGNVTKRHECHTNSTPPPYGKNVVLPIYFGDLELFFQYEVYSLVSTVFTKFMISTGSPQQ